MANDNFGRLLSALDDAADDAADVMQYGAAAALVALADLVRALPPETRADAHMLRAVLAASAAAISTRYGVDVLHIADIL